MMRPIRQGAVQPGDVNRIFLTGLYPVSPLALRGTGVWAFPARGSWNCRKRKWQLLY